MERKLELRDIAGYLPHSLYAQFRHTGQFEYNKPCVIEGVNVLAQTFMDSAKVWASDIKPILRPLSDLNKTIVHDGKEIVPIDYLKKIGKPYDILNSKTIQNQYQLFDYLHELKIDYRGLIDAGLAISVYDLDENPYE